MRTEILADGREATVPSTPERVAEAARRQLDVRGRTITTAIAWAVHEQFATLEVGDEIELETDPFPAIVPDLEAWCRATGHELVDVQMSGTSYRLALRKGAPRPNDHRAAVVVSSDGLEELLSPLGFALAAALGGTQVAVYLQGPAQALGGVLYACGCSSMCDGGRAQSRPNGSEEVSREMAP